MHVSGAGTVSGDGEYAAGALAVLAATPGEGQVFLGWTINGNFAGWPDLLTLTMNADHAIDADFAPRPIFADVPPSNPAYAAIGQLAARGIIRGCDQSVAPPLFCPDDPTLRAQMAALVVRAMGWGGDTAANSFTDKCDPLNPADCVDDELWNAVGILAAKGVAKGYVDGSTCAPAAAPCYAARDEVLNIQVISFVARAMVQGGLWTPVTVDNPSIYPNVPLDSGNRLDLLTFVANAGPVTDTSDASRDFPNFDQPTTRGWFARALWQALDSYFGKDQAP